MKFIYHIAIIIGIGLLLLVAHDDISKAYTKAATYAGETLHVVADQARSIKNPLTPTDITVNPAKAPNTPGALKVTAGLTSFDKVELSNSTVIAETNKNRAENGALPPLVENAKLDASAEIKLQDMFDKQYFEHMSPSGVRVQDLVKNQSYEYIVLGENLALGNFKDSKSLLDAWMTSAGHRANILNPHYTEIGVAVGKGTYQGQNVWMAVQHFAAPRSVCPAVDEVLHAKITLEEKNIESMKADLDTRKKEIDSGAVYNGMTTNEQIDQYNAMVPQYNNLVVQVSQDRKLYNSEVTALNNCITANTAK